MIIIDNSKYNIHNDGTASVATTAGINQALIDYSQGGQTIVGLVPGIYLIAANSQITIPEWTILNLNGATLKKEANGQQSYHIVYLPNNHSGICNGIVIGDKDEHDYSEAGTHEGGCGVTVCGAEYVTISDLEMKDCTGDGITAGNNGFVYCASGMSYFSNPAIGRFATKGTWNDSADGSEGWLYFPKHKLDLFQKQTDGSTLEHSRFQIGGNGYDKYCIDIDYFVMTYYDEELNCLGFSAPTLLSEDVYTDDILNQYPTARYVAFSFKAPYNKIETAIASWNSSLAPRLRTTQMCTHVTVERCHIHHCRRQGITGGGKFLHVKDCHIHDIRGTAPAYGIDVEDGYSFNQAITIERCKIERNAGGCIVICYSRDVAIRDCQLSGFVKNDGNGNGVGICFYQSDNVKNIIEHCHITGLYNAIADSTIRDSWLEACSIGGRIENCTLKDCKLQSSDVKEVELHNCKVFRTGVATQKINKIIVRNCELVDCGLPNNYFFPQDNAVVIFENNNFTNNTRTHTERENAWQLVTFTNSQQNGKIKLLRLKDNTYLFNNEDTVRPLFEGLTLARHGRAEICNNRLTAKGSIQSIGTLTSSGDAYINISDNNITTSYSGYLNSYKGIVITGKSNDYLIAERNNIELKKTRNPALNIKDVIKAVIKDNKFDAALSFSCDDAEVVAENNIATAVDFGTAKLTSQQDASQSANVDLTNIQELIAELAKNITKLETAQESFKSQLADVQNNASTAVTAETAKFKQTLSNILSQLCDSDN